MYVHKKKNLENTGFTMENSFVITVQKHSTNNK